MKDVFLLLVYFLTSLTRVCRPGGARAIVAENLLLKQQLRLLGVDINKDILRRVLASHCHPGPGGGPSWLTFLGHMKDGLWSVDLFRCGSVLLKSHWVMVVMDQFTRRIIGFAVHAGDVDGPTVCRMFNLVIAGQQLPQYLSSDHSPLFEYHRWQANLRVLEIQEVKTVPYVPPVPRLRRTSNRHTSQGVPRSPPLLECP